MVDSLMKYVYVEKTNKFEAIEFISCGKVTIEEILTNHVVREMSSYEASQLKMVMGDN